MEFLIVVIMTLLADPSIGIILIITLVSLAALAVAGMSVYGMTLVIKNRKGGK